MVYNTPPKLKNKYKQSGGKMRTTGSHLPDKWRYGKKTKAQWIQAFEEEAKH
jgi:hypothetical protein